MRVHAPEGRPNHHVDADVRVIHWLFCAGFFRHRLNDHGRKERGYTELPRLRGPSRGESRRLTVPRGLGRLIVSVELPLDNSN